jgi:hypothetical protein
MPPSRALHKSAVGLNGFTRYSAHPLFEPARNMMTRGNERYWKQSVLLAPLLSLALPPCAMAQSVSDFRLPAKPTSTPQAEGPVDPDNPTTPGPKTAPPPRIEVPTASPAPAPATVSEPPAATTERAAKPRPVMPQRTVPAAAVPLGTPMQAEPGSLPSPATEPAFQPLPLPLPLPATATKPPEEEKSGSYWWLIIPLVALAGVAACLLMRKKREERALAAPDFERPSPVSGTSLESPAPKPSVAAPQPAVTPINAGESLLLALEATRMSATLLNATLSYRLIVTNHGTDSLGPLAVAGDMIAAHASLPVEQQLALDGGDLQLQHEMASLAPGESAVLTGNLRLPLAAITPIRSGNAALFVPLARFRVVTGKVSTAKAFVIGETAENATAALRPFRLDLGPRIYSQIGQRELAA